MMDTLRRHWYNIGGVIAVVAIACLYIFWNSMSVLQILMLLNFIAILIHQFEEYGFPGGEPAITNMVMQPSDKPDRYPLNQNSAMIGNVLITYTVYLIPVFLPNIIWLGLGPVIMGLGQFIVHGIITNRKMKSIYNPGLGAVAFLHIPIGAYYIYFIISNGLSSGWDWLIALVYLAFLIGVIGNKLTYDWLADKNSKYPFTEEEMERFHVKEKLEHLKQNQ
ncbi:MAG: HXXEE domain-containing protein [Methanobacterium sp.]